MASDALSSSRRIAEGYESDDLLRFEDIEALYLAATAPLRDTPQNKRGQGTCLCKVCGNRYATFDGVRKHFRKKHSSVAIERGLVAAYAVVDEGTAQK